MISRILANAEGAAPNPLLPASYDLLWSSVVFVILLAFFWFKVLPNFKKNLDARTEAIEGRLEAAEKAQAEAAEQTRRNLAKSELAWLRRGAPACSRSRRARAQALGVRPVRRLNSA